MEQYKGRPVITSTDHPEIIYDALHSSIPPVNRGELNMNASMWTKTAQDAYEAVGDAFPGVRYEDVGIEHDPTASTVLYMPPGDLESALVNHGLQNLDSSEVVGQVDYLLSEVDKIKK